MTLSAPIRFNPLRGLRPANLEPGRPQQHLLSVEFTSLDGRAWQAIGGGDTLADALAFAHDSCPAETTWQPTGWNDLYGD